MKILAYPVEVPAPNLDGLDYDDDKVKRHAHCTQLAAWLKANGYPGKRTGDTVFFPVGEGVVADYMLAEDESDLYLIHLPYGDAYDDAKYLPEAEILRQVDPAFAAMLDWNEEFAAEVWDEIEREIAEEDEATERAKASPRPAGNVINLIERVRKAKQKKPKTKKPEPEKENT